MAKNEIPDLRDNVVKGMNSLIAHLQIYFAGEGDDAKEKLPATPETMKKWFNLALRDGVLK